MTGQSGTMMDNSADNEEPLDNELMLDLSDDRWANTVGEWEDGKEYTGEITVRQVSPGRFEVIQFEPEESAPAETETETEESPAPKSTKPSSGSGYKNPAVASMAEE